ncbi:hypothetical protein Tco_0550971 [Tanacetum coccineum]
MNPVAAQQVALDNALVAPEKRLKIEKCNMRFEFNKPQIEPTYQVTLDVLKLSSCYPGFLITVEVLEIYMHQFWNTIKKIKDTDAYQFKLDKQKFQIDTEVFCEILQICPRLPNQDFVGPPSEEEIVPFIKELGCIFGKSTGLDRLKPSRAQILWEVHRKATPKKARKFKKIASPSEKQTLFLQEEPAKKPKKQSTGVLIKDTSGVSVSKKKAPITTDRSKGIDLLPEAALLKDAQMKKVPDKLQDKTNGTNEGISTITGVPDVPKDQSKSENEPWGESGDDNDNSDDDNYDVSEDDGNDDDSDDDGNNNASDDERTESDEDENPNLNQNDDDIEEEYDDEYVRTLSIYESTDVENEHVDEEEYDRIDNELYKDVNVKLNDVEQGEEGKGDAEKTL